MTSSREQQYFSTIVALILEYGENHNAVISRRALDDMSHDEKVIEYTTLENGSIAVTLMTPEQQEELNSGEIKETPS